MHAIVCGGAAGLREDEEGVGLALNRKQREITLIPNCANATIPAQTLSDGVLCLHSCVRACALVCYS